MRHVQNITFTLLWLLFSSWCIGQQQVGWIKTYGGNGFERAFTFTCLPDSGVFIFGHTTSFGGQDDAYILRLDKLGNELYYKTHLSGKRAIPSQATLVNDSGYVIAGVMKDTTNSNFNDVLLLKLDSAGEMVWYKRYGGLKDDIANDILQTSDGGYIIGGDSKSMGDSIFLLIKTDPDGNAIWMKHYGDTLPRLESGGICFEEMSGDFLSIGLQHVIPTDTVNIYFVKTDPIGNVRWTKYEQDVIDGIHDAVMTVDSDLITVGEKSYPLPTPGFFNQQVFLKKFDLDANLIWEQDFGGDQSEKGWDVNNTSDGGFLISGSTLSNSLGELDAFMVKTDSDGNLQWERSYGGPLTDIVYCGHETLDHGYIFVGFTEDFGAQGTGDVLVIKTDSNGCVWYPKAHFGYSTDTLLPCDTLFLSDSSLVHAEDSLHTIRWGFGDGKFTYDQNPWHVYEQPGAYQLWLAATNLSGCSDTSKLTIIVKDTTTALPSPIQDQFAVNVYPNPNSGQILHVDVSGGVHNARFLLYDLNGKEVLSTDITADHSNSIVLSKRHFPGGVYLWQLVLDNGDVRSGKVELLR